MEAILRGNIMRLLKESLDAIRNGDSFRLKELSNGNIHNASIFQNEDSLSIGVVIYALSKIIDRTENKHAISSAILNALEALTAGKDDAYRSEISRLISAIRLEDSRLKKFIFNVIEQAQVKKGSAIHEHGISVGRVASIIGISRWELMQYLGKTRAPEISLERIPTEKRLELARKVFL